MTLNQLVLARFTVALISLLAPILAQGRQVLRVAPTGTPYTHIDAAIAAASPGDTILVATGTYPPFTLSKGLSIVSEPGAAPQVIGRTRILNVPSGQVVVVAGLTFQSRPWSMTTADQFALEMGNSGGSLCLKSCTVLIGPFQYSSSSTARPSAALGVGGCPFTLLDGVTCIGQGGSAGLEANGTGPGGVLVINAGFFRGGDAACGWTCFPDSSLAGHGIFLGSVDRTYLASVTARGGDVTNLTVTTRAGCGMSMRSSFPVFIRGGSFTGGTGGVRPGERGGDGIEVLGLWNPTLYHDGFPFFAGLASGNGTPGQPVSGPGTYIPRQLSELILAGSFLDRGTPVPLNLSARPSELHVLFASFDAGSLQVPGILEPVCSFATPRSFLWGLLTCGASGNATATVTVPFDPDLIGLPVFFESFAPTPGQLVVGPLTGGPIR